MKLADVMAKGDSPRQPLTAEESLFYEIGLAAKLLKAIDESPEKKEKLGPSYFATRFGLLLRAIVRKAELL